MNAERKLEATLHQELKYRPDQLVVSLSELDGIGRAIAFVDRSIEPVAGVKDISDLTPHRQPHDILMLDISA